MLNMPHSFRASLGEPRQQPVLFLASLAMCFSGFVIFEPAPVDIIMANLVLLGMLRFSLPSVFRIAIFLLCGFLTSNLVSMFAMQEVGYGVRFAFITAYLVATVPFFVGIGSTFGTKAIDALLVGYVVAALINSVVTIGTMLGVIPLDSVVLYAGKRATGFFKDPNVLGPFLIPPILYALTRIPESIGFHRVVWSTVAAINMFGVIITFSRAAWLNLGIAVAIFSVMDLLTLRRRSDLRSRFIGVLVIIAIGVLAISFFAKTESAYTTLVSRLGFQAYDQGRFGTQRQALLEGIERPFSVGIGPGQTGAVYGRGAHSLYVRVIAEHGYLGLVSLVAFILATIWLALKRVIVGGEQRRFYIFALAALLGVLANSAFIDTIHWRHFWLLLAMPWVSIGSSQPSQLVRGQSQTKKRCPRAVSYQANSANPTEEYTLQ